MTTLNKIEERIEGTRERLKQLEMRRRRIEQRQRTLATTRGRAAAKRRAFLIGAAVMAALERGAVDPVVLRGWLDAHVTGQADRRFLGLDGSAPAEPAVYGWADPFVAALVAAPVLASAAVTTDAVPSVV